MIIVADTSPLNYLVQIGQVDILPKLYSRVLIPRRVHQELQNSKAPAVVLDWAANLPRWCDVCAVESSEDESLVHLGKGERDAIQLALEKRVSILLMDDYAGRQAALSRRFDVAGTLATLEDAAELGLINFRSAFAKLEQTTFRISDKIREEFLRRNP